MSFAPYLILVTVPTLEEGRKIAGALLEERLAACVNILPGLESHYRWKGKIESATEVLLLIKSSTEHFDCIQMAILSQHPYECPEIVALAPHEITPAYRAWWEKNLAEM